MPGSWQCTAMVESQQPHQQVSARSSHSTNHPPPAWGRSSWQSLALFGKTLSGTQNPESQERKNSWMCRVKDSYICIVERHTQRRAGGWQERVTARLVSEPCAYFDLSVKDSPKRHCSAPSLIRCLGKNRAQSITHEWAQSHNTILIFPPIHMAKKSHVLQCKHWQQQYETNVLISRFCNPAHSRDCWWWLLYSQSEVKQNKYHVT